MADEPDRGKIEALEAEIAELKAEIAELHVWLVTRDRDLDSSVKYLSNRLARVFTLSARTQRLLRQAKYWKARCPKRPMPDYLKEIMMARYAMLGGFEHGKGEGAAIQVAKEFGVSLKTVQRLAPEYARQKRPVIELYKITEAYRRRYRELNISHSNDYGISLKYPFE